MTLTTKRRPPLDFGCRLRAMGVACAASKGLRINPKKACFLEAFRSFFRRMWRRPSNGPIGASHAHTCCCSTGRGASEEKLKAVVRQSPPCLAARVATKMCLAHDKFLRAQLGSGADEYRF